jgi:hypothetical protein
MNLTDSELLAFCGLVRVLVRLDGEVSPEERRAIEEIGPALARREAEPGEPYRAISEEEDWVERFWSMMDRASKSMTGESEAQKAALEVTRQEAREELHAALHHLAASDVISKPEWDMLTWLASVWSIPMGEGTG